MELLSFLLALTPFLGLAHRIADDETMSIAESVLGKPVAKAVTSVPLRAPSVNGGAPIAQPFYNIFTGDDGQGFVIVSTDRRAPKVIGYGEGKCDPNNLPPQLAALLAAQDSVLNANTTLPEHPSWLQRSPRLTAEGVGEKILETAQWDQVYPYNAKIEIKDGVHCLTGCVATAMAIAMKYNKWPSKYDWESMPLVVTPNIEYPELAQLMLDAGKSVYMHYDTQANGGSGADVNWVGHKLQSVFHYSPECQHIKRANFEKSDWYYMLHNEIYEGRVVIYAGYNSKWESHAYIVDGYNAADYYHVNWGWGSSGNGFFDIQSLEDQGDRYFMNAGMVINIEPDTSGKEYSNGFIDNGYFWEAPGMLSGCMINVDKTQLQSTKKFTFTCYFLNLVPEFVGNVGVALVDKDGVIKELPNQSNEWKHFDTWSMWDNQYVLAGHSLTLYDVQFESNIEDTDRLQVVTKEDGSNEWLLMNGTIEAPSYLIVKDAKASLTQVKVTSKSDDLTYIFGMNGTGVYQYSGKGNHSSSYMKGAEFVYQVNCPKYPYAPIKLTVKGKSPYGDTQVITQQNTLTYVHNLYGDNYEAEIELVNPDEEEVELVLDYVKYRIKDGRASVVGYKIEWYEQEWITALAIKDEIVFPGCTYTVTEICDGAFANSSIHACLIPKNVTWIGDNVFQNCNSLKEIVLLNPEAPALSSNLLNNAPAEVRVLVPANSVDTYTGASNWNALSTIEALPTNLTDETPHTIISEIEACSLSYTRTVSDKNWIGVYLPFDLDVTKVAGTYATLTEVSSDGVLEWNTFNEGKIPACTPFIFKPNTTGEITFSVSEDKLHSCRENNPVTTFDGYTLAGNFETKTDMVETKAYALSKGNFYYTTNPEKTLKPYRIFLTVPSQISMTQAPIRSRINGQDIAGIEDIEVNTPNREGQSYNLHGIPVDSEYKGVIIVNGKKVIRK